MNLETFPKAKFELGSVEFDRDSGQMSGELSNLWRNFFTLNTQNMEQFFANEGHLVPSRTQADIDVLSTSQFKARSLYNNDTGNFMGNTGNEYQNYTMNSAQGIRPFLATSISRAFRASVESDSVISASKSKSRSEAQSSFEAASVSLGSSSNPHRSATIWRCPRSCLRRDVYRSGMIRIKVKSERYRNFTSHLTIMYSSRHFRR